MVTQDFRAIWPCNLAEWRGEWLSGAVRDFCSLPDRAGLNRSWRGLLKGFGRRLTIGPAFFDRADGGSEDNSKKFDMRKSTFGFFTFVAIAIQSAMPSPAHAVTDVSLWHAMSGQL